MGKQKKRITPRKPKTLSAKSGMPSETMVYVGPERELGTTIDLVDYDGINLEEKQIPIISECDAYLKKESVTWISVTGLQDSAKIVDICNRFKIHPLIQEDILNTQQRTKIEEFDESLFITFKNLFFSEATQAIEVEQISVILGKNYLLSFQETDSLLFKEILSRLHHAKGNIRTKKADYLLYKILDTAVDQYFVLIDIISDFVEDIEEETMHYPNNRTSFKIQTMKKELMLLSKHVLPMREMLNKLESGDNNLIEERNMNYFRDVYDHTYQAYETIENHKSLLNDLMNIYFTTMSNKLNQVMKVLTIISTIFMPLSFLTGVYGMNFKHFPGLNNVNAYYYFWLTAGVIFLGMIIYFRRKKWF
ncbi:MAG TPA: magnesium/cobalt transporter CorA [Bacteroidia bacterium]